MWTMWKFCAAASRTRQGEIEERRREEEGIQNGIVKKVLEVLLTSNNIWLYGCGGVNEKEATIIKYHN